MPVKLEMVGEGIIILLDPRFNKSGLSGRKILGKESVLNEHGVNIVGISRNIADFSTKGLIGINIGEETYVNGVQLSFRREMYFGTEKSGIRVRKITKREEIKC